MRIAPEPKNESERLEALYQYDILDTDAEDVFDDFTRIASQICGTPISLISLVDAKRQWFKSKVGLDASETSRDIAFCAHAILEDDIFEVPDTHKDDRFCDNPLVTSDPNIRFYAGAPLISSAGHAIGTLCTISDQPQQLNAHQREALAILGRAVVSQLELRLKVRQLDKANERKTDFLSTISHEFRTPLNAIITLNQLMLEEAEGVSVPAMFKEYMTHINYSGKRLLDLVNSVLDLNKIEAGKMDISAQNINTRDFVDSLRGMMKPRAQQRGVEFTIALDKNVPPVLFYDESKLSQVILNLLSNAIKFTPAGGKVSLTVHCSEQRLFLIVSDNGVGIDQEDVSLLFDKFTQVGKYKETEGSGLGLAITKALVALMQGDIHLKSELGVGTTVEIDLPLTSGTSKDESRAASPGIFDKEAAVLVIEDNLINQEVAKAVFHSLGIAIDLAETGEEGVSMARSKSYDLIFMDLNLPGINGWEATAQIRKLGISTPVVALSADVFEADDSQNDKRGIQSFITKPIDKTRLIEVLTAFVPQK
ncbi:response regulator [Salinimonas sp. HHU 13199]|uniref:histidine kinase n=1 Tax=Salinimonas profundi TaxID=2729140 RepID=A0ABR8LIP8_9ALTE|nr:GAF domain-containing hybrid sensor histidine kinase/response regulator [Salinimonas profundi]MBD3585195.1 response regulator [Salinimonas profundi]